LFGGAEDSQARTDDEKAKVDSLKASNTGLQRLSGRKFLTNLACLVSAWALFFFLVSLVANDGAVHTFDPFQILGLEHGSDEKLIKKAYRKLSLQYHPDKNIGSKMAEEMFLKIAKAYEALTDETSKANYEKYGNPDGKQAMELSIGLPKFILDNPKIVLVLYLIGMVVIIPLAVGVWYKNSKRFGDKNIEYDTYRAFYHLIKPDSKLRHMPEILCCSAEFRAVNDFRQEDKVCISELMGKMQNKALMERPTYDKQPNILKGNLLLHAHLYRMTDQLTPALQKDLRRMLMMASEYINSMVEISHQRGWLETTLQVIRFAQCVKQGLFRGADPLQQLPYLDEEARKEITKAASSKENALREYLATPEEQKKGLNKLTATQRADVLKTCALIPQRDVALELYVEAEEVEGSDSEGEQAGQAKDKAKAPESGDNKKMKSSVSVIEAKKEDEPVVVSGKDIYENDLITLRMTLMRKNTPAPKKGALSRSDPAIAPKFPAVVRENLWVILANKVPKGREEEAVIHAIEKISDSHKIIDKQLKPTNYTIQHEIRFMAPPRTGDYEMQLYVFSDAYLGLDEVLNVPFSVKPASELPVYSPHPDDANLDDEPTLFEQVMSANADAADSSDDEDEAPAPAQKVAVTDKKAGNDDDDNDDDSDEE